MATYNLRCIASLKPTISSLPETKSLHDWENLSSSQPRRGLAVGFFSWYLFTNQRGNNWVVQWSSISWTWQVHSVTYTFWLDWQNITQIGSLSHIQKWKTLQMSKDMPMARCCIFPPKSGKTTFTKITHFQIQYVYIYIYLHMSIWKTLLSSWKQNAHTYTFLVAGPLNPNIQPLKAFQPIETTCHYAVIILT